MEIVDAHVHLWQPSARPWYPAMQDPEAAKAFAGLGDVTRMARDFLPAQLREETSAVELLGLVHVSAVSAPARPPRGAPLGRRRARRDRPARGDDRGARSRAEPGAAIEADLDSQSQSPRFRGIRVLTGLDPAGGTAADICAALDERDLVFDLVAHPAPPAPSPTCSNAGPTSTWCSSTPAGRPRSTPTAWSSGGPGSTASRRCRTSTARSPASAWRPTRSTPTSLRPWIEGCLDAFGPGRCIFGGNFPVEAMYGDYATLIDSVTAAVAGLSEADRRAFFVDNARRAYGLEGA